MQSQEKIDAYKIKLETEKRRLLEEIEEHSKVPEFGSDVDHGDEEADEAEEFQNELSIAAVIKERVNEIDEALSRISSGSYGICKSCDKEISESVLEIAPESELCAACKTKEAE